MCFSSKLFMTLTWFCDLEGSIAMHVLMQFPQRVTFPSSFTHSFFFYHLSLDCSFPRCFVSYFLGSVFSKLFTFNEKSCIKFFKQPEGVNWNKHGGPPMPFEGIVFKLSFLFFTLFFSICLGFSETLVYNLLSVFQLKLLSFRYFL